MRYGMHINRIMTALIQNHARCKCMEYAPVCLSYVNTIMKPV